MIGSVDFGLLITDALTSAEDVVGLYTVKELRASWRIEEVTVKLRLKT